MFRLSRFQQIVLILVCLPVWFVSMTILVSAGPPSFSATAPTTIFCYDGDMAFQGNTFTFNLKDGESVTYREFINGTLRSSGILRSGPFNGTTTNYFWSAFGTPVPYNWEVRWQARNASGSRTITAKGTCGGIGPVGVLTSFRSRTGPGTSDGGPSIPPDDRINWQFGDSHIGILYPGRDGSINLYEYATENYYFSFITPADIAPFKDNPPATNTLIKNQGEIWVYILTTGQIQFNFGPDREGKVFSFIMENLADREAPDSYYFDPGERPITQPSG